jgi:type IV secretory pathway ATPase VirB11/archaellum biosynthesis ATPase
MYEPFDWLEETDSATTTILVNEISPHLPIYAWGETLRRLLALAESGYQVVGTIHADSIEEVVAQLAAYPILATTAQIASFDVVVYITVAVEGDNVRRQVGSIISLSVDESSSGLITTPISV